MNRWKTAGCVLFLMTAAPALLKGADETVEAKDFAVHLVPDRAEISLGDPLYLSFVVENKTDRELHVTVGGDNDNPLGRPNSFTVTVIDPSGKVIPQRESKRRDIDEEMGEKTLAARGTYANRLYLPDWVTVTQAGAYTITAKRTLDFVEKFFRSVGKMPAEATTKLVVLPPDPGKLGQLIAELGEKTTAARPEWSVEEEMRALMAINDERTAVYYLKWMAKKDAEMKLETIRQLAKYKADEALVGLLKGTRTGPGDISEYPTVRDYEKAAEEIRSAAEAGLARSPHPDAAAFARDPSDSSLHSLTIVQEVRRKLPPEKALPLLRIMAKDDDVLMSIQAAKGLQEISGAK